MSDSKPMRILVVDDEEDVRVLVSRILKDMGYEVDAAAEGAEALEKIRARRPELVILDLMMPGVDGWGVLRELRTFPDPPPVVVMTALADYGTFTRVVREGASAYVCKPFRFHELVATCQGVLLASGAPAGALVEERRREHRRPLMVEVMVLSKDKKPIALGELMNLSPRGAQVDLGVPLDQGSRVRLAVHVPGGVDPLSLGGQVQWRGPSPRGFAHGLSFVDLSQAEQVKLNDLLRNRS